MTIISIFLLLSHIRSLFLALKKKYKQDLILYRKIEILDHQKIIEKKNLNKQSEIKNNYMNKI